MRMGPSLAATRRLAPSVAFVEMLATQVSVLQNKLRSLNLPVAGKKASAC